MSALETLFHFFFFAEPVLPSIYSFLLFFFFEAAEREHGLAERDAGLVVVTRR
jgi:hypothetical protein